MQEFRINNYITLKLENNETVIYVAGEQFKQCKRLLLNFSVNETKSLINIESIDDAEERSNKNSESENYLSQEIPVEVEFWAHCSNLQVWYEHEYNTKLLHRNLAFPLLRKLFYAGDPIAKKKFKEEIAKRILSGNQNVVLFLLENDYLLLLSGVEIETIWTDLSEDMKALIISELIKKFNDNVSNRTKRINIFEILEKVCDYTELKDIQYVEFRDSKHFVHNGILQLKEVDDICEIHGLESLNNLKSLILRGCNISDIKCLDNLEELEYLDLHGNHIKNIKGLENLKNLKKLDLGNNHIKEIENISLLISLEVLILDSNEINEIKNLENLVNLKVLYIGSNKISQISAIDNLNQLKELSLEENRITEIKGLKKLRKLRILHLNNNLITEIKGLETQEDLIILKLNDNKINEIKGLNNLKNLKNLNLKNNNINEIKGLNGLFNLEWLDLINNNLPYPNDNCEYEDEELEKFI